MNLGYLENRNNWISYGYFCELLAKLVEYTGDSRAPFIAGTYSTKKGCYDALESGGRLAVLIGDVRRRGRYTPIVKDVLNFPYGEIRSVIIKVQHNCTSDRKRYGKMEDVPILHEYCVVFKKSGAGERHKSTAAIPVLR